jgi:hypothetical protein
MTRKRLSKLKSKCMRNFVERIEFLSKRSFVGNLIFLPRQFKNKPIRTLV